jgi:putative transposase
VLLNFLVKRPEPNDQEVQNFCADKGYDAKRIRVLLLGLGYVLHVKSRGEEQELKTLNPEWKARRWVAERGFSWLNRFRGLLVRWSKKAQNFEAELYFACSWIAFRTAGVSG